MLFRIRTFFASAVVAAFLGACSSAPDQKVEGLPPLAVTEHVSEAGTIAPQCLSAMTWWHWAFMVVPLACSHIDFDRRTCDIYVSANTAPDTLEHERLHCRGYDHGGTIQRAFDSWRAGRQRQAEISGAPAAEPGRWGCVGERRKC